MRLEFDTRRVFSSLKVAQQALDEWIAHYNNERPHQSLGDATPASRFGVGGADPRPPRPRLDPTGEQWVTRRVAGNGVVCVGHQQVCLGKHYAGSPCNVLVTDGLLQFWVGSELLKTLGRTSHGEIRNQNAQGTAPRRHSSTLEVSSITRS
jgi:hypothetical protein